MISAGTSRKNKQKGLSQTGKKLTIKLSKSRPTVPESFEAEMWTKLQTAIRAIMSKAFTGLSKEELYQAVENLCIHKLAGNLFTKLKAELDTHIADKVKTLVGQSPNHDSFLELVINMWQDYCDQMLTIRSIFLYLDRSYIIHNVAVKSFWDLGLLLLKGHIQKTPEVQDKIIQGLLDQIQRERNGEDVNQSMIRGIVRMLTSVQLYTQLFERVFLANTETFYVSESTRSMDNLRVPDYLKYAEKRIEEENSRVSSYLDASTRKPLIRIAETKLLQVHTDTILEKGFDVLLDENRVEDIERMYTLLSRVQQLESLKAAFGSYMRRIGLKIVKDEEADKEMVGLLLQFKQRLDNLWSTAFAKNADFEKTIRESFQYFINCRQNKPAELIAKFIDRQLRTGNKGGTEEEVEALLSRVMVLFAFTQGKDVFEAFYKKDLSKRLLLGKSASYDLERSMISSLKSECGASFTSKLEGMFKDVDISKDLMSAFDSVTTGGRNSIQTPLAKSVTVYVHVLTTGFWPPTPMHEVTLPPHLAEIQTAFTEFYLGRYQGRRLTWQHTLGHCLVRFLLPNGSGRKELSVSLFQTLVLLLFNDNTELPFKSIVEQTGIEVGELKRTLQSLACGKVRVLTKVPKGRDINDDDKFIVSPDFKHKAYRIKINSIQMKETKKENDDTHAKVFQDRQYQIDAAIVRIMKARKKLTHTLLVAELYKQLVFPAKPQDLKKRIESLIDREYLERDENESSTYHYLA